MASKFNAGVVFKGRKSWRAKISKTDEDGNKTTLSKTLQDAKGNPIACNPDPRSNKGRNAAKGALKRWRDELVKADGDEQDAKQSPLDGVTVAAFLNDFLGELAESKHVEASTLRGYRSSATKISESLGDVMVTKLSSEQIQRWENSMLNDKGLSVRSVVKHHRLLSEAFNDALKKGKVTVNPCKAVTLPKQEHAIKRPQSMDRAQVVDLLKTLAAMPQTRAVSATRLALLTGCRCGELCAIQWRDVDTERGYLHINKAVGIGTGESYVKGTKNASSTRDIPLSPKVLEAFDARRAYVLAKAEEMGVTPSPAQLSSAYVLNDALDGGHAVPQIVGREFKQLRDELGITDSEGKPLVFHSLRHSFASVAIQSGADPVSVSKLMGHASPKLTMDLYANGDSKARAQAMSDYDAFLGDTKPNGEIVQFMKAANE